MEFTGERVVPWSKHQREWVWVLQHHLQRYTWALSHVAGKRVVDLGSGSGYGAYLMSFVADSVVGLERDLEAVAFADYNFGARVQYRIADLDKSDIPPADVYTCFEVLEHLSDPKALLEKINGTLLWSLPVNDPGRFHKHVFSVQEAERFIPNSHIYRQAGDGRIYDADDLHDHETKYVLGVRYG